MAAALRLVVFAALAGTALMAWRAVRNPSGARGARRLPHADWSDTRATRRAPPEWLSDYRPRADGRVDDNALIDGAVEDSFPASDPPAFMQSVVAGPPPHEEAGARTGRRRKRAIESSGAHTRQKAAPARPTGTAP
jgi:hypothetical protein